MRFEKGTGAPLHRVEYQMEEGESLHAYAQLILDVASQRFALPACGRAWTLLGSRKKHAARVASHTSDVWGFPLMVVLLLTFKTVAARFVGRQRKANIQFL